MRQVTRVEFFNDIIARKLDVHPTITNDRFPYASAWIFPRQPGRPVYGKSVDRLERGALVTDYYLNREA